MHQSRQNVKGFTLVEILLIVAALAIISGATIFAINPVKQFADARNGQRQLDVAMLWNALHQYALDNHGDLPDAIQIHATVAECLATPLGDQWTACKTNACSLQLPELLDAEQYLIEVPVDPSVSDLNYSGYNIVLDPDHNNRVTVCAPWAENGEVIVLPQ